MAQPEGVVKVVAWMRKSIAAAGKGESHIRKAYALLGASLRVLGRDGEAEAALEEGLAKVPDDPEILFGLARLAADRGDYARAVSLYERVLGADVSNAFTSLDPGILGDKTLHNLALSKMALGDWPGAREAWERGLAIGGRPGLAMALLEAALEAGDMSVVRRILDWAEHAEWGQSTLWNEAAGRVQHAFGLNRFL